MFFFRSDIFDNNLLVKINYIRIFNFEENVFESRGELKILWSIYLLYNRVYRIGLMI